MTSTNTTLKLHNGSDLTDHQNQRELQTLIMANKVQPPDSERLYMVYVAPNVIVDMGYGADLEGRGVPRDGNRDGVAVPDRGAFES